MHWRLQHHHIILIYLRCKLIKSMGCHMLWILTSEEIDELVLDGIIIPHWHWKITLVLSHWLNFMNLNLELFVIHQRCCNTHCQRISIIGIILWIWYLIIFMDFYILDENFIQFLSYINIDSPEIIPILEWYVPSGHFFTTNSIIGEAKYS